MPAVHAKTLLRFVHAIGPYYLVQTGVWRRKFLVLMGLVVFKVVRTTEIIFGAGAIYCWVYAITIHKKLYFAFAPPAVVVHVPGHVSAHILAPAFYAFHQRVQRLAGRV